MKSKEKSMQHAFDRDIAAQYGLEEAIILNNFEFWIDKNIKNEKHFHDGHYWTYNSTRAMAEMMPYMTPRKIGLAIDNLIEKKLLIKGCYNTNPHDRTNWYAITEFGFEVLKNPMIAHSTSRGIESTSRGIESTSRGIESTSRGMIITDSKTTINTDTKDTVKLGLTPPKPIQSPKKGLFTAPKQDTAKKTKYAKNKSKLNSIIAEFSFDVKVQNQLDDFLQMVEQAEKWMTEVSFTAQLQKLSKLSANQQLDAVQKTINRGWASLDYAIDEIKKSKTPSFETATKSENQIFIQGTPEWQERQDRINKDIAAGNIF